MYKYYCNVRNVKYDPEKENLKCCYCGSTSSVRKIAGDFYCKQHYNHIYRFGHIITHTIYEPNDFIFEDDVCKIVIRDKYQNIVDYCIIDKEDYDKVKMYKWYKSGGYAITKGVPGCNSKGIDISNIIFNDYSSMFDHQNNNRMDNQKANLRIVSSHQNAMNMGKKITNTSGVTGVQFQNKKSKKWTASITYQYKLIWLGVYENFDDAVIARLKGEARYFKTYSPNYNAKTGLIEISYISKTDDEKIIYISVDLDGNIVSSQNQYTQKIS